MILDALKAGDGEAAAAAMRTHLGRIEDIVARIRQTHGLHFAPDGHGRREKAEARRRGSGAGVSGLLWVLETPSPALTENYRKMEPLISMG